MGGKKRPNRGQDGGSGAKKVALQTKKKEQLQAVGAYKDLDMNMTGMFFSCVQGKESRCVKEAYQLLEEYCPKETTNKAETEGTSKDQMDYADAFEKELAELNQENRKNKKEKGGADERRFISINVGIRCSVFIKFNVNINPVDVALRILKDADETKIQKARFCLRMIPIENTCKATMKEIEVLGESILPKHFPPTTEPKTFAIVYNSRYSQKVDRDEVIKCLATIIGGRSYKVDLKNPDLVVVVEIVKNICGIGVLPEYYKYKKYNIFSVLGIPPSNAPKAKPSNNNEKDSEVPLAEEDSEEDEEELEDGIGKAATTESESNTTS